MNEREAFEKWVTDMEPAYAASNLERNTNGNYKVYNVFQWWLAWQASRNAALEEAAAEVRALWELPHSIILADECDVAAEAIEALKEGTNEQTNNT